MTLVWFVGYVISFIDSRCYLLQSSSGLVQGTTQGMTVPVVVSTNQACYCSNCLRGCDPLQHNVVVVW